MVVDSEVVRETLDSLGEHGYLNLCGAGVRLVNRVLGYDRSLVGFIQSRTVWAAVSLSCVLFFLYFNEGL